MCLLTTLKCRFRLRRAIFSSTAEEGSLLSIQDRVCLGFGRDWILDSEVIGRGIECRLAKSWPLKVPKAEGFSKLRSRGPGTIPLEYRLAVTVSSRGQVMDRACLDAGRDRPVADLTGRWV